MSGRTLAAAAVAMLVLGSPTLALASDTPNPGTVTVAGSLQSELGCPGDWQPDCGLTHLNFDAEDDVWQATFNVPAGNWEYKAPLNDSWSENYGAGALRNGPNIGLTLAVPADVKFYYDHKTHWITDNMNSAIAVAPGNFQSELGCAGDWQPGCLRSWLQDPDGDGTFSFTTAGLPAGGYEVKVAHNESWDLNFGAGGVQNGANIPFSVPVDCSEMVFDYDIVSHLLDISVGTGTPQPASVTIAGSLQSELGCPGDWQPDCANTHLSFDPADLVWQGTFPVPAGNWEYKAPLNDSWDVNYGANATLNGANIGLNLPAATDVKFYYSDDTHWVTDNQNAVIATLAGNFQSELGCPDDWQPWCLRSWLQDPDGDGIYIFTTAKLPAGSYEVKVAHNESWDLNFGAGGVQNGSNIPFTVPESCAPVFFSYDPVTHVLTVSAEGVPNGDLGTAKAHWVDAETLAWNLGAIDPGTSFALHHATTGGLGLAADGVTGADTSLNLTLDPAGLPASVISKFPHLTGYTALKIDTADLGAVPALLKGQLAVAAVTDGVLADATSIQIPGVLDDLFTYDGALGAEATGSGVTVRLWAPTAKSVDLLLFDNSNPTTLPARVAMTGDATTGVWSASGPAEWKGQFYQYEVEVYVPSTGRVENNHVTDPYSLSLSKNSHRSQIVDLNDEALKPQGWDELHKPKLRAPEDIVLYELHVRDFSIADATVPEAERGTFRAFSRKHSSGMRHLRGLARAGLTHVHLLPSFDLATVPEDRADQVQPAGDLASYPPDSDMQQAAISAVRDQDGFNWGYDPFHFTVPEGSYAIDPDGATRVREFREMVRGLNRTGLRVVMDVVYNHTTAAGQSERSVLDRIVPGYYHRLNAVGQIETSTCCANTASEHAMMEKLMVDSVLTWAKAYKVDGFRFDLMGHHMKANMLKLRSALDALTPHEDGVDGPSIYVYGEGWNFGEVANNARGVNAVQRNMAGTGIGTFSDRLRDGVRGGNPFSALQDQGFVNGLYYDSNGSPQGDERAQLLHISDWIRIGLAGDLADYEFVDASGSTVRADQVDYFGQQAGYTADPQESITYVASHDNETLFDTTQLKALPSTSMDARVRIQNLANSIVMLGQGIPFFHAGQELLRSKSMDRDSFNSGDWFNALDFTLETNNWGKGLPGAEKNQDNWPLMQPLLANPNLAPAMSDMERTARHMLEMLRIRRGSKLFRLRTGAAVKAQLRFHNTGPDQVPGLIVMSLEAAAPEDDDSSEDHDSDDGNKTIVVLFNATTEAVNFTLPATAGRGFELHEAQRESADPVVRSASWQTASGTFNVPARTAAVFVSDDEDDDSSE